MFGSLARMAAIAAAIVAAPAFAQSTVTPPADLHPPINLDADTLRSRFMTNNLGLKPGSPAGLSASGLPYGIDYNHEAKTVVVPLAPKSEWGVGVGLNMNSSKVIELSPGSALGLQQPNRTPGLMLHGKF
jgi:hypothetical protein